MDLSSLQQYWPEALAFLAGSGGTVLWDMIKERTSHPFRAAISIDEVKFNYPQIDLSQFERARSEDEQVRLMRPIVEIDSIFIPEKMVDEFNEIAKKSGVLNHFIEKDYSGSELANSVFNALHFVGKIDNWARVAEQFSVAFGKAEEGSREDFQSIYLGIMQDFLETGGLMHWLIGMVLRGDMELSALEGDPELPSLKLVSLSRTADRQTFLVFGQFFCQFNPKPHNDDLQAKALTNFCQLLDTGQGRRLSKLFSLVSNELKQEKELIEKFFDKLNSHFALSIPKSIQVSARIHNTGRFPFVAKRQFLLSLPDGFPQVELSLRPYKVPGAGSDPEENGATRTTVYRSAAMVKVDVSGIEALELSGEVAPDFAERLKRVFEAGNTKTRLEMSVLTHNGPKKVVSRFSVFGESE